VKATPTYLSAGFLAALLGLLCSEGVGAAARTPDHPFTVSWNGLFHVEEALHFVHFTNAQTGWAVGENGVILATQDGGELWQIQTRATENALWGVQFADAYIGWAVGRDGTVLLTLNGGDTWRAYTTGKQNLTSVCFVDAHSGWAVGDNGVILATHDGGQTWQTQTSHTGKILWHVDFTSTSTGWIVGEDGTILATGNGGETWLAQTYSGREDLTGVHFVDPRTGWAVGRHGTILATSDGKTWKAQRSHTEDSLTGVHFIDARSGWAVGDNGVILATSDGGKHWKAQRSGTAEDLGSVHFVGPRIGWAVGGNGSILVTHDGGKSWERQQIGTAKNLRYVHFVDPRTGWAVGVGGTILATGDAGKHWRHQTSPIDRVLWGVRFVDASRGWAVGERGTILATYNGGAKWLLQRKDGREDLWALFFVDPRTGWAVGRNGMILATRDGGRHWKREGCDTTEDLADVHFVDASHGWIVGSAGTILTTSDTGGSWQHQPSPTTKVLTSVHFADAHTGWAVGYDGTILATLDGRQWQQQSSGTKKDLEGVCFADRLTGWAVGESGTILATRDGGEHWQAETSDADKKLWAVSFSPARTGWAVGDAGTLLQAGPPIDAPWIDPGVKVKNVPGGIIELSFVVHPDVGQPPPGAQVEWKTEGQPWKAVGPQLVQGTDARWHLDWKPGAYGVAARHSVEYRVHLQDGGAPLPPVELGTFLYEPRQAWPGPALKWMTEHPRASLGTAFTVVVFFFFSTRLILLLMQLKVWPISALAVWFYLTPFGHWRLYRGYRKAMLDVAEFKENARRYLDLPYELLEGQPADRPQGLAEVVAASLGSRRVFVVGEGGRGKSTLCHYVAVRAAKGLMRFRGKRLEPVIIEGFEITGDLVDAVTDALLQKRAYVNRPLVESQLGAGKLLVLFDGVSEVHHTFRQAVEVHIHKFAEAYPKTALLLTSRDELPPAVRQSLGEAATVQLRDVDDATERTFLGRHLKRGDREVESLIGEVRIYYPGLPRIPLMLHLAAVVYDRTGAMPKDRTALFDGYVQQLLRPAVIGQNDLGGLLFAVRQLVRESYVRTQGAHGMTLDQGIDVLESTKTSLRARDITLSSNSLLKLLTSAGLYRRKGDNFTFYYGAFESYFAVQALERDFDRKDYELLRICAASSGLAETWELLEVALQDKVGPSTLRLKIGLGEPILN